MLSDRVFYLIALTNWFASKRALPNRFGALAQRITQKRCCAVSSAAVSR